MSQIRVLIAVAGLVVALTPVGALAQGMSNEDVIAQNQAVMAVARQQANLANDLARCRMAATGVSVPGAVGFSEPAPAGGCAAMPSSVTAMATSASGTCVTATRALTKLEFNQVNEFEIASADAIADNEPPLTMPADISALIGC